MGKSHKKMISKSIGSIFKKKSNKTKQGEKMGLQIVDGAAVDVKSGVWSLNAALLLENLMTESTAQSHHVGGKIHGE